VGDQDLIARKIGAASVLEIWLADAARVQMRRPLTASTSERDHPFPCAPLRGSAEYRGTKMTDENVESNGDRECFSSKEAQMIASMASLASNSGIDTHSGLKFAARHTLRLLPLF
jgi:hypothetical protein